jgi:hypothetical protein
MIVEVLKVFLESMRLIAETVRVTVVAMRELVQCRGRAGVIIEAFKLLYTVRRPVVKFHSTEWMYMDQSLPGTESVFCFWPVLNPAPQCNFPMAMENFIVESFHGQEFSTNAHSQTCNFPLVLYINGIFRWCSFH